MSTNRGVAYSGPSKVKVRSIPFPELVDPRGKRIGHGVGMKVMTTSICLL
jgi:glutathione-independent formaldehyde dehydrogenase